MSSFEDDMDLIRHCKGQILELYLIKPLVDIIQEYGVRFPLITFENMNRVEKNWWGTNNKSNIENYRRSVISQSKKHTFRDYPYIWDKALSYGNKSTEPFYHSGIKSVFELSPESEVMKHYYDEILFMERIDGNVAWMTLKGAKKNFSVTINPTMAEDRCIRMMLFWLYDNCSCEGLPDSFWV